MDRLVLRQDILDEIKRDPILFGKVAQALNKSSFSLPRLIYSNDEKLTNATVQSIIRKHLGFSKGEDLTCKKLEENEAA